MLYFDLLEEDQNEFRQVLKTLSFVKLNIGVEIVDKLKQYAFVRFTVDVIHLEKPKYFQGLFTEKLMCFLQFFEKKKKYLIV